MIPSQYVLDLVLKKGFKFRKESERCKFFKKEGSTDRVSVRKAKHLSEEYVVILLKKIGCDHEEIRAVLDMQRMH